MNKKAVIAGVVGVVLVVGAFLGGAMMGPQVSFLRPVGGMTLAGPGGRMGGPMANLTEEERARFQNMSDSERQQFMQDKLGDAAPGADVLGRGGRGGSSIEGEVLESTEESLVIKTTSGGSQTIYIDTDTVLAYAEGASGDGAGVGDTVIALTQPEGDVLAATALIIK